VKDLLDRLMAEDPATGRRASLCREAAAEIARLRDDRQRAPAPAEVAEATVDPDLRGGQPCCPGTRFPVSQLLAELAEWGEAVRELADEFDQDPEAFRSALRWAARNVEHRPRAEALESRLRAARDEMAAVAREARRGIERVDILLPDTICEEIRTSLKGPFFQIESACDETSLRNLASLCTIRIVLGGMHVWHPGPPEEADLYRRRCEARRRVFPELAEKHGIEDAEERRRQQMREGKMFDEELAAKFRIIEEGPRWRFPLGDGVEPAVPKLIDGRWVVEG